MNNTTCIFKSWSFHQMALVLFSFLSSLLQQSMLSNQRTIPNVPTTIYMLLQSLNMNHPVWHQQLHNHNVGKIYLSHAKLLISSMISLIMIRFCCIRLSWISLVQIIDKWESVVLYSEIYMMLMISWRIIRLLLK